MTRAVIVLDDYRSPIETLHGRVWPANRERGDYREAVRASADLQLRRVVCGFCGKQSPMLDGPTGRAWFSTHTNNGDCSQKVVA